MSPPAPANAEPQSSAAPDWNNVPFAVTCARCGHDLHGQTEPKCPACSLGFDWRDACPIEQLKCGKCGYHLYGLRETRCPECGEWFDWRLVLLDYRRRQKDLFEYRWREEPLRSFLRTWKRALRPKSFWQSLDIHDPPELGPMLATAIIGAVITLALQTLAGGLSTVLRLTSWYLYSGTYRFTGVPPTIGDYLLEFWYGLSIPADDLIIGFLSWWVVTLASLLMLRQSMALFRVRDRHVVRVGVYALTLALPAASIVLLVVSLFSSVFEYIWLTRRLVGTEAFIYAFLRLVPGLMMLGILVHALWSIRCGYRYYLRIPHSWGVAIASQGIAVFAGSIIAFWLGASWVLVYFV